MGRRTIGSSAVALAFTGIASFGVSASAFATGNPVVVSDKQTAIDPYGTTLSPPAVAGSPIQPNTQIEPSIAVNPGDHNDVVTDFQVGRVDAGGDADNGFATSLDGGLTWSGGVKGANGALPGLTKNAPSPILTPNLCPTDTNPEAFDRASDAVMTFGADPTGHAHGGYFAYAQSLVFDDTSCQGAPSGMAINVSSDGGLTWKALIVEADSGAGLNDKNWVVTDNQSGTGHHRGRTYIVWDRVASIEVAYCDPDSPVSGVSGTGCDKITNWSSVSGKAFFPLFPGQGIGVFPVVLNNGSLGVIYDSLTSTCAPDEQPNCPIGGSNINWGLIPGAGAQAWPGAFTPTTFAPVPVATYASNGVQAQRAGSLPQLAYDTVTGDAVAVWEDDRFRTDGGATPGLSDTSNQNDAVMSLSTPVGGPSGVPGATWSAPVAVDDPTHSHEGDFVDHFNTMVAIGADGIWRFGYRQRFEPSGMSPTAAGPSAVYTYYQESRNQGATFTAPLKVNKSIISDPQFGAFSRNGLFEGDYQQLAAGGNDETYVTRDEAFAPPGVTSCLQNFSGFPKNTGGAVIDCQNQTTFVAHLLPQTSPKIPDVRVVPALVLVGVGAGVFTLRRRKHGRRTPG